MNKLAQKPHLIFLFAIPLSILIGILSGDNVLEFNVHDSYFIIAHFYLAILVSILYAIVAIGY
jgi:cytochrome c oxidase subunit 1